jgi:hypothetical protein
MDQSHDIAYYFDRGLRPTGGHITHIAIRSRNLAAITGWAKDEPFTAIVYIGEPHDAKTVDTTGLLNELEQVHNDLPPLDWEH